MGGSGALMENSAMVTAIAGEDLAGLAIAYDRYAASLYDFCLWMQRDPELAAGAVCEAFAAVAPSAAPSLPFAGELRSRLYAAARNACDRPAPATEARPDGAAGQDTESAGLGEARRLARAALADLDPLEQEVVELRFRHRLTAIETADVLEILPSQVPDLTESARLYLEEVLGALVVVRAGAPSCPRLAALLDGRDEPLTVSTGKLAARHIGHCRECARHKPGELRPDQLRGLLPLAGLPDGLREQVLSRPPADQDTEGQDADNEDAADQDAADQDGADRDAADRDQDQLASRDGPARPSDSRRAGAFVRRDGRRASPAAATAVAAVMVCIAAAVTAIVMTASGTGSAHALAAHQISVQAAASGSPSSSAPATTRASHSPPPKPVHRSAVAAPAVSVVPAMGVGTPAPAYRTTSTASASVAPKASKTASPSAAPTRHGTPSPTPTDSGSSSPSGSPSPSPSASPS
jgi:DNA-directed RNA polymerase specialized sigma24 family protein